VGGTVDLGAIEKQTPTITWSSPADIVYGTPLSSMQLDAKADVPGNFAYKPIGGTVLNAGKNQTLLVTFMPNDTTDYTTATASVSINVKPALLTITAANCTWTYGNPIVAICNPLMCIGPLPRGISRQTAGNPTPWLGGTIVGLENGDAIWATYSTTATLTSPAGTYAIVPTAVAMVPGKLSNYAITLIDGTLTITPWQATPDTSRSGSVKGSRAKAILSPARVDLALQAIYPECE
jgi:hypothetical protein